MKLYDILKTAMAVVMLAAPPAINARDIVPGDVWLDTSGNPINAHGGGILYHNGKYYWYGEYKKGETVLPEWATWECYRTDVTGVSCYSSPDMVDWTFEGIVLPAVPFPHSIVIDLGSTRDLSGFQYLPRMESEVPGAIRRYRIYVKEAPFKY